MDNRRRFARWQLDRRVKAKLGDAESFIDCTVNDISFKGLKVSLEPRLHPDTFLRLNLVLGEETTLEVEVWVVWHKTVDGRNQYGFYFSRIKDPDKEKIYQFVRKFYPQQFAKEWWKGTEPKTIGGAAMEDHRIFQRFNVQYPLRFLEPESGKEGIAYTKDISARGIGFVTPSPLTAPMALEMWLKVPDKGAPLYTRGEVAWSRPINENEYQVGINLERPDLMEMARVLRTG